jgi:hypothetical protein
MPLALVPYTPEHVPEVRAFNRRLTAGGAPADQEFPETPDPRWLPDMYLYVAVEDSQIRGGYILRRQQFSVSRETIKAEHYRLPLSEGVVDRAYANLGLRLVRDALARQPRLYALGMGGWDKPLPKMLKALKWRMCEVPFHFKIVNPAAFLRNIRALRTNALRRFALDAAALTGTGWLGMKALGIARRLPKEPCDLAPSFAGWADDVWQRSQEAYALTARRDAATLDALYPPADPRFLRMRAAGGWALLLDTKMEDHKQFGNMRVGTIVDCLAPPDAAPTVMRAAAALLESRGVDLIVSNQLHDAWSRALLAAGFRRGPSNYLLALAPAFAKAAGGAPDHEFHFNRGDGDGPIHL